MKQVVAIALVVVGVSTDAVRAQSDGVKGELLVGAGYLWAHSAPDFRAYDIGVAVWLSEHWGVAGRFVQAVGHDVAGWAGAPRYSILTARYRGFVTREIDLTVGMGARVTGSREVVWMEDREPWGEGVVLELLVGRTLSKHVGIKGGVTFQGDWREDLLVLPVVLAVVAF